MYRKAGSAGSTQGGDGVWSAQRIAVELYARREMLLGQFARRGLARGVPVGAREEIVCDAITALAISPRPIVCEEHLYGAFWRAVENRVRRFWEGRHLTRLGSRGRVELDEAQLPDTAQQEPGEHAHAHERARQALDWLAELTPRERRVLTLMATRGVGEIPAARMLGWELGEVRAAARSARQKLDRVALIARAGRMCSYRRPALAALARGSASRRQRRRARAHLGACPRCRRVYLELCQQQLRELRLRRATATVAVGVAHPTPPGAPHLHGVRAASGVSGPPGGAGGSGL